MFESCNNPLGVQLKRFIEIPFAKLSFISRDCLTDGLDCVFMEAFNQ